MVVNKMKWSYNPDQGDNAISEVEDGDIVIYPDNINKEVLVEVVQMWNDNKSVADIREVLDKHESVTLDEADFVIEQIESYIKLGDKQIEKNGTTEIGVVGAAIAEAVLRKEEASKLPVVEGSKVKKTRQPRTTVTGATNGTVNPDDYLKQLEEKMVLTKALIGVVLPEIPTGVSKVGREILIELHKQHSILIANCIANIQKM